jgi:hypothetical protein
LPFVDHHGLSDTAKLTSAQAPRRRIRRVFRMASRNGTLWFRKMKMGYAPAGPSHGRHRPAAFTASRRAKIAGGESTEFMSRIIRFALIISRKL